MADPFNLFQQWQRDLGSLVGMGTQEERSDGEAEKKDEFAPLNYGEIPVAEQLDVGMQAPEDKAKTSKAMKAALQAALQDIHSDGMMYMGVQILSPHETDKYEREVSAWLALPPRRRPSSMNQAIGPDRLHLAAAKGDEEEVREIIGGPDGAIRTLTPDRYGRTALHFAVRSGSFLVVKLLLESWEDPKFKEKLTCAETKDDMMPTDIAWADRSEQILYFLLPYRFHASGAVINTIYSRFKISKQKPGSIFTVYDMLHMEEKLWQDCGLHTSDTINAFDKYRLSYHSTTDVHLLYKRMLRDKAQQPLNKGDFHLPRKNKDGSAGKSFVVLGHEFDEEWQKENHTRISKTATVTLLTNTVKEKEDYRRLTTGDDADHDELKPHEGKLTPRGAARKKYHRVHSGHWKGQPYAPLPASGGVLVKDLKAETRKKSDGKSLFSTILSGAH